MAAVTSAQERSTVVSPTRWRLPDLAGRFVEISGFRSSATLSLTFGLVLDAQQRGEPVCWTTSAETCFYPPDVADFGVDLASLVVVRLATLDGIARAGEKLIRSGGFGLVVLDLGVGDIPIPLQSRLTGLAHHHHAALVCITKKHGKMFSLGSLVSLRVHAERKKVGYNEFACALRVLKDKRRGRTWTHEEIHRGPPGLY